MKNPIYFLFSHKFLKKLSIQFPNYAKTLRLNVVCSNFKGNQCNLPNKLHISFLMHPSHLLSTHTFLSLPFKNSSIHNLFFNLQALTLDPTPSHHQSPLPPFPTTFSLARACVRTHSLTALSASLPLSLCRSMSRLHFT